MVESGTFHRTIDVPPGPKPGAAREFAVTALFDAVLDLDSQGELVRRRPYGVIDVEDGCWRRICLRPFPKLSMPWDWWLWGDAYHRRRPGNRCLLYYNQPRHHPRFLALKYVVSTRDTTLATFRRAFCILDEVARLKGSDALLCDASNARISDRLLARWGWQPHKPQRWHRNFIKRLASGLPPPASRLSTASPRTRGWPR